MNLQLQQRDWDFLIGLFESRLLLLSQARALYYPTAGDRGRVRIAKLKKEGLVREKKRRTPAPSILFLSSKGYKTLLLERKLLGFPSLSSKAFQQRLEVASRTVDHELTVVDSKIALVKALNGHKGLNLDTFYTWSKLFEFQAERQITQKGFKVVKEGVLKPDAFARIQRVDEAGAYYFFFEIDKSSESSPILVSKALSYRDYFRRGGLAIQFGKEAKEYKDFPFRALFLVKNKERRNNIAEALILNSPPIRGMVWLTTQDEFENDPLGAIWLTPGDYMTVTKGSLFDPFIHGKPKIYRRQPAREEFINKCLSLRRLF